MKTYEQEHIGSDSRCSTSIERGETMTLFSAGVVVASAIERFDHLWSCWIKAWFVADTDIREESSTLLSGLQSC